MDDPKQIANALFQIADQLRDLETFVHQDNYLIASVKSFADYLEKKGQRLNGTKEAQDE